MKSKLVLHTKISGEIFLSIFANNVRLGEVPLGTDAKAARKKAGEFVEAVRGSDAIIDEIT